MHSLSLPHLSPALRWGRLLVLLSNVALIAALAAACGGDSEVPDKPTPTIATVDLPDIDETDLPNDVFGAPPPALTVTVGEVSIEAALGTFCYGGVCADAIADITPVDALLTEADQLTATLASETIAEVSVTAGPTLNRESQTICTSADGEAPAGPICEGGESLVAWIGSSSGSIALAATADGATIDLNISTLEPETYVVAFFVRFESGGDASYGVLLDVSE